MGVTYHINKSFLDNYYTILGVKLDLDFFYVSENNDSLSAFSPLKRYSYMPESSKALDIEMQKIMENLCSAFEDYEHSGKLKRMYHNAVIALINLTQNLNVLPPESDDYVLGFHRLNKVLYYTLVTINSFDPMEVIDIGMILNSGNVKLIDDYIIREHKAGLLFAYIGWTNRSDSPDYTMFIDETDEIDADALLRLYLSLKSKHTIPNEIPMRLVRRPSYAACVEEKVKARKSC